MLFSFARKHPILSAPHPLVKLIVRHIHLQILHPGVQLSLATLRRQYWLLKARTIVKQVIHQCVPCVREKAAIPLTHGTIVISSHFSFDVHWRG